MQQTSKPCKYHPWRWMLSVLVFLCCENSPAINVDVEFTDVSSDSTIILLNQDDDDGNGQPDKAQTSGPVLGEGDLQEINVSVTVGDEYDGNVEIEVETSGQDKIKLWPDALKAGQALPNSWTVPILNGVLQPATRTPIKFWVEGIAKSTTVDDAIIKATLSNGDVDRAKLTVLSADLDVNGDGDLDDSCDGLETYVPGYELDTAKLHTGSSYGTVQFSGPQSMNLIIDNLPPGVADTATVRMIASAWNGYCENGVITGESPILPFMDFSLTTQNNVNLTQQVTIAITGNQVIVPIYCHDYGAWCEVEIDLQAGGTSVLPQPLCITVPLDGNDDRLADVWQIHQINDWNTQYSASLDNTLSQLKNTWPQLDGDKEEIDPDKSGPLFSHATAGDGLDVVKEYRGYLTDGGSNTSGGYKRLSVSRKELLIEISEMSGIQGAITGGTNNTVNYSLSSAMQATESFYRSKYGVETFWIVDSIVPGGVVNYGDGTGRINAYISSDSATTSATGNGPFNMGGKNFVWDDQKLKVEDGITYNSMFGSEMDHFNTMNKDLILGDFIRLRMVSRACMIIPERDANNNLTGKYFLRYNPKHQAQTTATGSRVEAAFVAEEGPTMLTPPRHYTPDEYNNVIQYVVAHECGHLFFGLVDVPSGAGDLMNHASNPGAAGLGACGTSPTESSQLNLVDRKSTN